MSKLLTFYIDMLFSKEYFQAVKEGILVWNTAFRRTGARDALQVKYTDSKIVPAEQHVFVSYDLMIPGIKSNFTWHPRTRETLPCRVNIGHGFQKGKLDNYLLSCGTSGPRIITDRYAEEVGKELLQSEITGEVGHLLGLRGNLSKNSYGTTVKVGKDVCQTIYFGYSLFRGSRNCYDEREQLR